MRYLSFALVWVMAVAVVTLSDPAHAQNNNAQNGNDIVLGDPAAPLTIIEYSSLTCPYCASFHQETLPRIKEEFIDTGRVKWIYRDFQLDARGQMAAMVARCTAEERFYPFLDVLFQQQSVWARSAEPRAVLARIAKFGGISEEQLTACWQDTALYDSILQSYNRGVTEYRVQSTPTFLINGEKITGAQPFEVFAKAIEDAE